MKTSSSKNTTNINTFAIFDTSNNSEKTEVKVLGEKLMELSNLILTSIVFVQLLPSIDFNSVLFILGLVVSAVIYLFSYLFLKKKGKLKNDSK